MNSSCIHSLEEYETMIKVVESVRATLSYYHFNGQLGNGQIVYFSLPWFFYMRITLYSLLIVFSLIANLLVILVICTSRRVHLSTNMFMLNLAVCDLAILASCMWVELVLAFNEFWPLGAFFCKLNSFMQIASVVASVLTLVAIACERFVGIMYPLKQKLTRRKTLACIAVIWLVSLSVAVPSFMYRQYSERNWLDFVERHCDDLGWPVKFIVNSNFPIPKSNIYMNERADNQPPRPCGQIARPEKRIYYTFIIAFLFFLPISVMCILYSLIIRKIWLFDQIGEVSGATKNQHQLNLVKRKKAVKMLVWIMILFVVCWSPLEMMLLYMEYASVFPSWWRHVEWLAYFLAYANTAINPYIYAGMSDNYKHGARRLKDLLLGNHHRHCRHRQHTRRHRLNVRLFAEMVQMVPIEPPCQPQPFRHFSPITQR